MARSSKTIPIGFNASDSHGKRVSKLLKRQGQAKFESSVSIDAPVETERMLSVIEKQVMLGSATETAVGEIKEAMENALVSPIELTINSLTESPYAGLVALESDDMRFDDPKNMSEQDKAFFGLEN